MCRLGTLTDPVMKGNVATYYKGVAQIVNLPQGDMATCEGAAAIDTLSQALPDGTNTVLYKIPMSQEEAVACCLTNGGTLFEPRTAELREATLHLVQNDDVPGKNCDLFL